MIETAAPIAARTIEDELRDDLAQGDAFLATVAPILRHLVSNSEHSVFGDDILARVRGMFGHIAVQLLDAVAVEGGGTDRANPSEPAVQALVAAFAEDSQLLAHVHATAMEWQLTERLNARLGADPVLSPLVQALIAAPEPGKAGLAMAMMAAQARFAQAQRRMELPLAELPGDLLHGALQALGRVVSQEQADQAREAAQAVRAMHDEARSRIGLMARLISGMGAGATAALDISHAGAAMFVTALSLVTGMDRENAILATNEGQVAKLALALRAAGLKANAVSEQVAALHPDIAMPVGFDDISPDRASALLAAVAVRPGA